MWRLLTCYLSGQHDFSVSCEPGTIFLRCVHCNKRSNGWALKGYKGPLVPGTAETQVPTSQQMRARANQFRSA